MSIKIEITKALYTKMIEHNARGIREVTSALGYKLPSDFFDNVKEEFDEMETIEKKNWSIHVNKTMIIIELSDELIVKTIDFHMGIMKAAMPIVTAAVGFITALKGMFTGFDSQVNTMAKSYLEFVNEDEE